jgi:hypothetical protein
MSACVVLPSNGKNSAAGILHVCFYMSFSFLSMAKKLCHSSVMHVWMHLSSVAKPCLQVFACLSGKPREPILGGFCRELQTS